MILLSRDHVSMLIREAMTSTTQNIPRPTAASYEEMLEARREVEPVIVSILEHLGSLLDVPVKVKAFWRRMTHYLDDAGLQRSFARNGDKALNARLVFLLQHSSFQYSSQQHSARADRVGHWMTLLEVLYVPQRRVYKCGYRSGNVALEQLRGISAANTVEEVPREILEIIMIRTQSLNFGLETGDIEPDPDLDLDVDLTEASYPEVALERDQRMVRIVKRIMELLPCYAKVDRYKSNFARIHVATVPESSDVNEKYLFHVSPAFVTFSDASEMTHNEVEKLLDADQLPPQLLQRVREQFEIDEPPKMKKDASWDVDLTERNHPTRLLRGTNGDVLINSVPGDVRFGLARAESADFDDDLDHA